MAERARNAPTIPEPANNRARARPAARSPLILPLALVVACTTGCTMVASGPRTAASEIASDANAGDGGTVRDYLGMLEDLIDGDAFVRADILRTTQDAVDYAPTTANRMRYALALSVPGHDGSNPEEAAQRLRDLIAANNSLLDSERMLAVIQLRHVEHLLILERTSLDLQEQMNTAMIERDTQAAERIRLLQTENDTLRRDLEEATSMLDTIMNIEESISEREDQ